MSRQLFLTVMALALTVATALAQEEQQAARFSHNGIKGAVGFGGFNNDFDRELTEGGAASLSLGYGFSNRWTLWLSALGVEHPENAVNRSVTDFGGLELNLQYKFLTGSRWQPYGKVGVGLYATGEKDSNLILQGGGLALAAGIDYFFSRHVGIGLEAQFKGIEFDKQRVRVGGKDVVSDLNPDIDGKSAGLMLTLTIQ